MIPDHIIDKSEAAAIERWGRTGSLRAALTAALEAVAADIWDAGYDAGSDDENAHQRGVTLDGLNQYTPNPYRASETA